ncbi:hypothetical protein ACJBZ2_11465, partial [Streptococcus suis]
KIIIDSHNLEIQSNMDQWELVASGRSMLLNTVNQSVERHELVQQSVCLQLNHMQIRLTVTYSL